MAEIKMFWMVIGLGQPGGPQAKQPTRVKAESEARRLAVKHPGVEFYVLETVARAITNAVQFDVIGPKSLVSVLECDGRRPMRDMMTDREIPW